MTSNLTAFGYQQTKQKLARLEQRLSNLNRRTDLSEPHLNAAQQSCKKMMAQYLRELKLYEATHPESAAKS